MKIPNFEFGTLISVHPKTKTVTAMFRQEFITLATEDMALLMVYGDQLDEGKLVYVPFDPQTLMIVELPEGVI